MVIKAIKTWLSNVKGVFTDKATLDDANNAPYKLEPPQPVEAPVEPAATLVEVAPIVEEKSEESVTQPGELAGTGTARTKTKRKPKDSTGPAKMKAPAKPRAPKKPKMTIAK